MRGGWGGDCVFACVCVYARARVQACLRVKIVFKVSKVHIFFNVDVPSHPFRSPV